MKSFALPDFSRIKISVASLYDLSNFGLPSRQLHEKSPFRNDLTVMEVSSPVQGLSALNRGMFLRIAFLAYS
jgi:hypothetical protein